jgi:hypothetical protein
VLLHLKQTGVLQSACWFIDAKTRVVNIAHCSQSTRRQV